MNLYITGASGFVGSNLISYFSDKLPITKHVRGNSICIKEDVVIHLAGMAHDLKNVTCAEDYYLVNTNLTIQVFDKFLESNSKVFIYFSSVKAATDHVNFVLTEDIKPNPVTHYGKSKLLAEQYILSRNIPKEKRIYILRPCMIHGPGNKGNLNLLYNIIDKGLPWPLGAYENKRSFCSIQNLCFLINEIIFNQEIPSGIYNISDDDPISTNEIIDLIAISRGLKSNIWKTPKFIIKTLSYIGDFFKLPLNSNNLTKLTENFIVSNSKIKKIINKPLPLNTKEGFIQTFNSFEN